MVCRQAGIFMGHNRTREGMGQRTSTLLRLAPESRDLALTARDLAELPGSERMLLPACASARLRLLRATRPFSSCHTMDTLLKLCCPAGVAWSQASHVMHIGRHERAHAAVRAHGMLAYRIALQMP